MISTEEHLKNFLEEELPLLAADERYFFDRLIGNTSPIVIYGSGKLGRKLARSLMDLGNTPLAFVDNNPQLWSQNIEGVPVYGVQEAVQRFGNSAIFVVSVWSPGHDRRFENIKGQLESLGCHKVVHFLPLFWKYAESLLPHYRLDLPSRMLFKKSDIEKSFLLLEDEKSRLEFIAQLKLMLYANANVLPPCDPTKSTYFPEDLFQLGQSEVFVDCGAFDGDTTRALLLRTNGLFGFVVAYEPDPENFLKLKSYAASLPAFQQNSFRLHQCALGSARGTVRFDAMGSVSSAITQDGKIEVLLETLDLTLEALAPTYIKMDIEGSEMEALEGGRKIIEKYHPRLACCVYHKQDHLWEIPLKMKELNPDYPLYLRRYDDEFWDVVCYSAPHMPEQSRNP